MPIDSGNLALKGLDELFSTEEKRQEEQREQVQQIPIDELHPFTNHPFKVVDDEAMTRTCLLYTFSEPTRRTPISYAVFCLKKKKTHEIAVSPVFHNKLVKKQLIRPTAPPRHE